MVLRDLQPLLARHDLAAQFYGHLGQGCIHGRYSFDLRTAQAWPTTAPSWRRPLTPVMSMSPRLPQAARAKSPPGGS